jgi:ADP-ribosylglycohydrolase
MEIPIIERYQGSLLGLAIGDAMGVPLEFMKPGTFTPVKEMIGGGIFGLKPREWTDGNKGLKDTSKYTSFTKKKKITIFT